MRPITGRTVFYAVLGHPIAHTLSPVMQNAALEALDLDARYLAFDVAPEALLEVLAAMARMGFRGANLTIPHKEVAFRGMTCLAESALQAGSVNTVRFLANGGMEGHSTDGDGMVRALAEELGVACAGARVLVIGCGGAGRAAALRAAGEGAVALFLANRGAERMQALAEELRKSYPALAVQTAPAWPPPPDFCRAADIVIQSTALGMTAGELFPFTTAHFRAGQVLLDMTYVLPSTPFMDAARLAGARVANGLSMLLHQGARSLEIWTGMPAPLEVMRRALFAAAYPENPHV